MLLRHKVKELKVIIIIIFHLPLTKVAHSQNKVYFKKFYFLKIFFLALAQIYVYQLGLN